MGVVVVCLRFTFGLALLSIAFLASAFSPQDYFGSERIAGNYSVDDAYMLVGESGGVLFYRGEAVSAGYDLQRLSDHAPLSPNASYYGALNVVSESVGNCSIAYAEFSQGLSVCYDGVYNKFRCEYLWDQGLWQNILPFDIVAAKAAIVPSLANLSLLTKAAFLESQSLPKSAEAVFNNALAINDSAGRLIPANDLMRSHPAFSKHGRLARCSLNASDVSALVAQANVLYATRSASEIKRRAEGVLSQANAKPHFAAYAEAYRQFDEYAGSARFANKTFKAVRGIELVFIAGDLLEAERALASTARPNNDLPIKSFNETMRELQGRLDSVNQYLGGYVNASGEIAQAKRYSNKTASVTPLEQRLIALEIEAAIGGSVKPSDFSKLSYEARLLYDPDDVPAANSTLGGAASSSGNAILQETPSVLLLAGAILLAAVLFAAFAIYERRKHRL